MSERIGRKVKIPGLSGCKIVDEVVAIGKHIQGGEFEGVIQKIETESGEVFFRFTYYKDGRWSNRPLNAQIDVVKNLLEKAKGKG